MVNEGRKNGEDFEDRAAKAVSLIKNPSIYFGHPVNVYNTEKERKLIGAIMNFFPHFNIENPNQSHHQENYKIWREKTETGMNYYFDIILPEMYAGIFLPFEDGMWGKGVFREALNLHNRKVPIWEINFDEKIHKISKLNYSKYLSIEETIRRTYGDR